jgi:hypothetical protein
MPKAQVGLDLYPQILLEGVKFSPLPFFRKVLGKKKSTRIFFSSTFIFHNFFEITRGVSKSTREKKSTRIFFFRVHLFFIIFLRSQGVLNISVSLVVNLALCSVSFVLFLWGSASSLLDSFSLT